VIKNRQRKISFQKSPAENQKLLAENKISKLLAENTISKPLAENQKSQRLKWKPNTYNKTGFITSLILFATPSPGETSIPK
jgi:hypothetical protein